MSFRVTQRSQYDSSLAAIQLASQRAATAREAITSGQSLRSASQSPADARIALSSSVTAADQQRYIRQADDAAGRLNAADGALETIATAASRASELASTFVGLAGASASSREALAAEVEALRSTIIAQANTSYLGTGVFAGTGVGDAYDTSGVYLGNDTALTRTVDAGTKVAASLTGPTVFGADGSSIFDTLTALADAIRAGDTTGVNDAQALLALDSERITNARGAVGALTNAVETAMASAADRQFAAESLYSSVAQTDTAKGILELTQYENSLQASLAVAARVGQVSLLNFLR